jgi:hypothetical protein
VIIIEAANTQQIVQKQNDPLQPLISLIEEEQERLSKGARSRLSIGMGDKAEAIKNALTNAKLKIGGIEDTTSTKDLYNKFLAITTNNSGQSLYKALNIHRISWTRKNGNSFFTNSTANSLTRIKKFIENEGAVDGDKKLQK